MNIHNSYFAIKNPLLIFEQWLNPHRHEIQTEYNGGQLTICWTQRAESELTKRQSPLIIEMQIYFSCVVQKRVLFHEQTDLPIKPVNEKLSVILRPVQAASCDPIEYAKNHPVARELTSKAARSLRSSTLKIDFKHDAWLGEFYI